MGNQSNWKKVDPVFWVLFLLFFACLSHADERKEGITKYGVQDPRVFILAHTQVEVTAYLPSYDAYHVHRADWPGANDLYVTRKNLVKSIKSLSYQKIAGNPNSVVGNVYATDEDLILLVHDEGDGKARAGLPVKSESRGPASVGKSWRK